MGTLGFQGRRFDCRLPDLLRRPDGEASDIVVGDGAGRLLLFLCLFLGGTRTRTWTRASSAGVLLLAVRAAAASVAGRRSLAPDADGGLGRRSSGSDSRLPVRAWLINADSSITETPALISSRLNYR